MCSSRTKTTNTFITIENSFNYTNVELFQEEDIKKLIEESNQKKFISKTFEEH